MRHGALAAEVGHRHDRSAAGRLHQRLRRARRRDEGVGRDVDRHPEAFARRVGEAPFEVLGRREGDRVHEQVELAAPGGGDLGEDAVEIGVGAHVARRHQLRPHRGRQLAHVRLDPLALEGERELGPLVREPLRDRPGDRALVRDAQDERALAREP
jgi:hypothetical protein